MSLCLCVSLSLSSSVCVGLLQRRMPVSIHVALTSAVTVWCHKSVVNLTKDVASGLLSHIAGVGKSRSWRSHTGKTDEYKYRQTKRGIRQREKQISEIPNLMAMSSK